MVPPKTDIIQNIGSTNPDKLAKWLEGHFGAHIEGRDGDGVRIRIGNPRKSYTIQLVKANSPDVGVLNIHMNSTYKGWILETFENVTDLGNNVYRCRVFDAGVCIGYVRFVVMGD